MDEPSMLINHRHSGFDQYFPENVPAIGSLLPHNTKAPLLFQPLTLRNMTFKNRIWSPMCQYSSDKGHATEWHLIHIGGLAVRGVGAITMEATAVLPEGRISPEDAGLWDDSQMPPLKRIVDFCHAHDTKIGIQLAHAGRKASTLAPWVQGKTSGTSSAGRFVASKAENGWPDNVLAPSAIPYSKGYPTPKPMTLADIEQVKDAFVQAVRRCRDIGYDFIELHAAHGYLIHSFYSPLSNSREDMYGGSLENRIRLPLEIVSLIREEWPDKPLSVRISASDWADCPEKEGNIWKQWGIEQSIHLCKSLQILGVDIIDCSSGGNWSAQKIPLGPGYQVPFAENLKAALPHMRIGAVGLITSPAQAERYLREGKVDIIYLGRELLRRPDFALHAAKEFGVAIKPANQYERAWVEMLKPAKHRI